MGHKLYLDFPKDTIHDFDRLVDAAGESTRVAMVRKTIRLYSLLFSRKQEGYRLFAEREIDGKIERVELIGW